MAEMTTGRKRVAVAFVAVGIALIVQRTIASVGEAGEGAVVAPVARPGHGEVDTASTSSSTLSQRQGLGTAAREPSLRADRVEARRRSNASIDEGGSALFAAQSWQPPAPAPAPPAAPPAPVAPPFPYAYMGSLADDAGRTAFFTRGDRVLAVRAGDTVDGTFHVDHLDESSMNLTYVPLDKSLRVALGGTR